MAWFNCRYECEDCNESWESGWSCLCDDDCPSCGHDFTPLDEADDGSGSTDFTVTGPDRVAGNWDVRISPDTADDDPSYVTFAFLGNAEAAAAEFAALARSMSYDDLTVAWMIDQAERLDKAAVLDDVHDLDGWPTAEEQGEAVAAADAAALETAAAHLLAALIVAEERVDLNDCEGEEGPYLAAIRGAIETAQAAGIRPADITIDIPEEEEA